MARRTPAQRKGTTRPAKDAAEVKAEFEVVEEEAPAAVKAPLGIESALIIVTLVALVAAFVLIQMKLHASFGKGWPF